MTNRCDYLQTMSILICIATLGSCAAASQPDAEVPPAADGASKTQSLIDSSEWLNFPTGVRGIFEDRKGNLWFASRDGLCRYTPSATDSGDDELVYFKGDFESIVVGGIQEDSKGQIWLQSDRGIHRLDGETFTRITDRDYSNKDQWAMADGDLWFGVDAGVNFSQAEGQWGAYRLRDGVGTFFAFPEPPSGERHRFYPLTSGAMHGKDGLLWFGTFNAAFGFDGESFDIIGRERMGRADDPRDIGLRGYHLDRNGNLWMADNGAGVYVYNGTSVDHFTATHKLRDEDTDGNSLHRSFSIAEDDEGNIWFGTIYSGVWRYEPSESDPLGQGVFTNYAQEQGLPCEGIWTIYKTRSGELLFAGTDPDGVYRFNEGVFERVF
ncbi:MAG: ligand-binding sensor domain-containing protein [Phycisphaerales bacterium]|jgi:ligand-binding sensor domain-containing protein